MGNDSHPHTFTLTHTKIASSEWRELTSGTFMEIFISFPLSHEDHSSWDLCFLTALFYSSSTSVFSSLLHPSRLPGTLFFSMNCVSTRALYNWFTEETERAEGSERERERSYLAFELHWAKELERSSHTIISSALPFALRMHCSTLVGNDKVD